MHLDRRLQTLFTPVNGLAQARYDRERSNILHDRVLITIVPLRDRKYAEKVDHK